MERDLKFEGAASAFVHEGVARALVSNFKLGGQPVLGRVMADLALPAFHRFLSSIAVEPPVLVTWVPSHPSRTRERGYNQAEILARFLAAGSSSVTCRQLVEKVRLTMHQRGLDRDDRLANLAGSFAPCAQAPGLGMTHTAVIVVDDVSTTGATGCAVASVVAECAGLPVYLFSFSKVVTGVGERHD
jgi:predicted amidophosphoribosyltransferase